jgi:ACT domain-containing protein
MVPRKLRRTERAVTRDIAGETLLVPIRDRAGDLHHIFALNPVATHVWNVLTDAASVEQLVASVCATFEVDEEQAERDVTAFLEELRAADLVSEV